MFILVCERRSWCHGVRNCGNCSGAAAVCPKIGYPKIPKNPTTFWRRTPHFWPSPRAQTKHSKSRSASCTQLLGLAYHRRNPLGWEADEIMSFFARIGRRPQISCMVHSERGTQINNFKPDSSRLWYHAIFLDVALSNSCYPQSAGQSSYCSCFQLPFNKAKSHDRSITGHI